MSQHSFDFPLTELELATVEQLVSYKVSRLRGGESDEALCARIEVKCKSAKLIDEAKELCLKWNVIRNKKGLKPYT